MGETTRVPPVWRRARRQLSGQRRKEVMLSDLGVSARHSRRLGGKLEVCFQKCVKSVLGPHHSKKKKKKTCKERPKSNAKKIWRWSSPIMCSTPSGSTPFPSTLKETVNTSCYTTSCLSALITDSVKTAAAKVKGLLAARLLQPHQPCECHAPDARINVPCARRV